MRCLYLAHRAPFPPAGGAKVRAFHSIKYLHEAGHEVIVATLVRNELEAQEIEGLSEFCHDTVVERTDESVQTLRMVGNLLTPTPSTMGYFHSPALHRRVRELHAAAPFDLVICHSSSVAPYALPLKGARKILDFVDMDSQKWLLYSRIKRFPLSLGYWLEGQKLARAEARLADHFDLSLVVTQGELDVLQRLAPGARSDYVSNGVDLTGFEPSQVPYDPNLISFVGRFDYFPNEQAAVWFAEEVLGQVTAQFPDMTLQIVGAEPSGPVRALVNNPNVVVTGTVASVAPFVTRSLATVAPLHIARGVQNKVLESMAMGVPALISPEVAKGVEARDGDEILVCETAQDYVTAISSLINDTATRDRLAIAGRARAEHDMGWSNAMDWLGERISELMEAAPADRSA